MPAALGRCVRTIGTQRLQVLGLLRGKPLNPPEASFPFKQFAPQAPRASAAA